MRKWPSYRWGATWASLVVILLWSLGTLTPLEKAASDARLLLRGKDRDPCPFIVIGLDDATIKAWPEPTALWGERYANLLRRLKDAGAKAVVFDFVHAVDPDPYVTSPKNALFGEEILKHPTNVVLGFSHDQLGRPVLPASELRLDEVTIGLMSFTELPTDPDGIIRSGIRYRKTTTGRVDSIAETAARLATGKKSEGASQFTADAARWQVPVVSAVAPSFHGVKGRVAIVGFTAQGGPDLVQLAGVGRIDGPSAQARLAATLANGSALLSPQPYKEAMIALLGLALATAGASWRIVLILATAVWAAISVGLVHTGIALPILGPALILFAGAIGSYIGRGHDERRQKDRIRRAFDVQLAPETADYLLSEAKNERLGAAKEVIASIMFLDVRNSTGLASERTADEMFEMLNALFGRIVPLVAEHGGVVMAFQGDGFLATFGAISKLPNDADAALSCANAIIGARLDSDPMIGIGLHRGKFQIGNLGTEERLQLTVIGDAVNVASRIESATKELKVIALATDGLVRASMHQSRPNSGKWIEIRNRPEGAMVYSLSDLVTMDEDPERGVAKGSIHPVQDGRGEFT